MKRRGWEEAPQVHAHSHLTINPSTNPQGASRGIGRACALELGKYGVKVVVNYASSADSALKVVEELKAMGTEAVAIKVRGEGGWVGR